MMTDLKQWFHKRMNPILNATKTCALVAVLVIAGAVNAQSQYWQQHIKYTMNADVDVTTNIIKGTQQIAYTNQSPDTLNRIFLHLYWNAFKPGSQMAVASVSTTNIITGRNTKGEDVTDYDTRFKIRVDTMKPADQGWCNVSAISMNGKPQRTKLHETILEVDLDKPILPKQTVNFTTSFDAQIPKMSRRSGRDSKENIRYSIGQWYPKVCEYDNEGWHADPFIAREFYGVWGDFDVTINIDKNYKLGATGVLQNAAAIGWGYDKEGTPLKAISTPKRAWHFAGENIHDFVWAADPDYAHITRKIANGPLVHFIYKNADTAHALWNRSADSCVLAYPFIAKNFGPYPHPVYSFIQGGGGGTEYPMATLIVTHSLGTMIHEWMHSWYQMLLGTNENLYAWMDEGFTSYAEARTLEFLRHKGNNIFEDTYKRYVRLANSPLVEPMSTHANAFVTNFAYNNNAYVKGAVFMQQLGYIIGQQALDRTLLNYYWQWRYKHPTPNDFIRVAEKASGMELDWYKEYWMNTTKKIDYKIGELNQEGTGATIRIERIGELPMPVDVLVTFKDSSKEWHYIPLDLMYGDKPAEDGIARTVYPEWGFVYRQYTIKTTHALRDIVKVEIDPTQRLADVNLKDNKLELNWP